MKDLKENIQRNNIKKIVLSVALGMFCYCTNNAMKKQIKIDDVNFTILSSQVRIYNASVPIQKYREKIYSTIKDEHGKVTKKNVLDFIKKQISTEEKTDEELKNDIKTIEQYFHLEEIKNDNDECNEENLTEIFWDKGEGKGEEEKIKGVVDEIKSYFIRIIFMENIINNAFKDYYEAKKAKKGEVEKVEDVIIEEIMNECCGKETDGDMPTKFFANLGNLCPKEMLKETKETILATIKRRITLKNPITEDNLKSFLRQKIGIEEKKEEEEKDSQKGGKPAEEGGCPCCDCWGKKKNQVENENSKEKPVKIYNNP